MMRAARWCRNRPSSSNIWRTITPAEPRWCRPIRIGRGSNLQDNVSAHVDTGYPLTVGAGVSVGHNAVLHGCTIEDDVLIGMSATVMNGARVGAGSLVAAGALITQGTVIPPRSLVAGVPAKVRRELPALDHRVL